MKTITANDGVKLAFLDEGTGLPVVFVPGYGATKETWSLQTKPFLQEGFRVISLDRRSHGDSGRPSYGQRMSRHGKDLSELLDALQLRDVLLIGGSMGVSTILAYVSLFGDERLRGIAGIDQTPKMINDDTWNYGMKGLTVTSFPTYFDAPLPNPIHHPVSPLVMLKFAKAIATQPRFDLISTRPLLLDHAHADWRDVIGLLTVPALFIAGRQSPFWPCEHAPASAALCKNGQAVIIEDSGHAVNWEQPAECNQALITFAKSL